jgi:hypothetical protein
MTETTRQINETVVQTKNYRTLSFHHCPANCKLTYINYIGNFVGHLDDQAKKDFDEVLKKCRIAVYLNTNSVLIKDWILKHYEVYSCSPVPIGYGNNYQYHIVLRNKTGIANMNMRPSEYGKTKGLSKERVKEVMLSTLKNKRRKTDVVDLIVNQL